MLRAQDFQKIEGALSPGLRDRGNRSQKRHLRPRASKQKLCFVADLTAHVFGFRV